MYPYINVFGQTIPSFGLVISVGIGVGLLLIYLNCLLRREKAMDPILTAILSVVGAFVGAALLRPITRIPDLIINWEMYAQVPVGRFFPWLFGELVFYGGLIGGVLTAWIFCRSFKMSFLPIADAIAPGLPLGHAFGRMGCFLGGCCYGMEVDASHPLAVFYPERTDGYEKVAAPAGVPLFPSPAVEAVGNVLIAAIVLAFGVITLRKANRWKWVRPGQTVALYGILYAVQRFILEYFRGDAHRGIAAGFSTSQYISMGVFACSVALFAVITLRKRAEVVAVEAAEAAEEEKFEKQE